MLRGAGDHLRAVDPAAVARAEIRRATARARPPSRGTLRAAVDPSALGDGVRLRVAARPLRMTREGDTVMLEGARRRLRLPASTAPALQVVLDRGAVDVADLTGLDAPSRVVLARRLVREGCLELDERALGPVPAPPPLAHVPSTATRIGRATQKVPRRRAVSDRPSGS